MTIDIAFWREVSVGQVADVISGPAFQSKYFGGPADGIRLLRGDNIEPGGLRWDRTRTWPEAKLPGFENLLIRTDDLILGMDRPIISAGLKLARAVEGDGGSLLVQRVARIRPHGIDDRFLYLALQTESFKNHLLRTATGTQLPHVTIKAIKAYRLRCPDTAMQLRIVDTLEDHISRLDAAERLLKRNQLRLMCYRDALLRSTLTGQNLGAPLMEASLLRAESDDGKLPSLPVGWRWQRLGEIAEVTGGITKDSKNQTNPEWREVPYLRVANVQRGRLDLSSVSMIKAPAAKIESMRLEPGDVLLNEGGDRDKLARGWVWEGQMAVCIHQNHVFRARIHGGAIEPRLLSWSANTFGGPWAERNGKQTTNLASISMRRIRLMPIPVPPVEMQAQIVRALDGALEGVDLLVSALERAQRRQMSLRRSLLDAAFSGRLTRLTSDVNSVEEMAGV